MKKLVQFYKDWALPIAMISGVIAYFLYVNIPFLDGTHEVALKMLNASQPILIFLMLFVSFCKIPPSALRPCRWHGWVLLFQIGIVLLLSLPLIIWPNNSFRLLYEGAIICLICPTACASPVIVTKLGGNTAHTTTYIILINIAVALLIPILFPLIHPHPGDTFLNALLAIIGKVFPMIILPLLAAWIIRFMMPRLHQRLQRTGDLAFHLWTVTLCVAIIITTRSVVHSDISWGMMLGLVLVSVVSCALQFFIGRKIGEHFNDEIAAGQALGQKNTSFAIWLGYTYLTPVTAIVGGLYSIWHNVYNSYQLYEQRKALRQSDQ